VTDHDYDPNILHQIQEWVWKAIQDHGQGERIQYAVSQVAIATQQGYAAALGVSLTLPGLVLGEAAVSFGIYNLLGNTEETINEYVRESIERMRTERSSQASKVTEKTENVTPSGIILS
jgi:hypothetical protein